MKLISVSRILFSILLLCAEAQISISQQITCASTFEEKEKVRKGKWRGKILRYLGKYHGETTLSQFDVSVSGTSSKVESYRHYLAGSHHMAHRFAYQTTEIGNGVRQNTFKVLRSYRKNLNGKKSQTSGGWAMFLDYRDMRKALAKRPGIPIFPFIEKGGSAKIISDSVVNEVLSDLLGKYYRDNPNTKPTITVYGNSTGPEKELFENILKPQPDPNNPDNLISHNGTQTAGFLDLLSIDEEQAYYIYSIEIVPTVVNGRTFYDFIFNVKNAVSTPN